MTFECFLDENYFSLTDTDGRILAESYVTQVHWQHLLESNMENGVNLVSLWNT